MKFLQYVIAVCVLAGSSFAFRAKGRAPSATRRQIYLNLQMHSEFIAKMQKIMLASAVGISIGVQSSPVSSFSFPVLSSAIPVARADYRAQQKSTYFRFSPKLIAGRAFFKYELKKAIDSGDWKAVEKFFELYPSKINKNDPNQIDAYDSYLNSNIIRPMKVLAGSFAERGSSVKQRNLLEQEEAFEAALSNLEGTDWVFHAKTLIHSMSIAI